MKESIERLIKKGTRLQGEELTKSDIGRPIANGFGRVLPIDVGKCAWKKSYGMVLENDQQRDVRQAKERKKPKREAKVAAQRLALIEFHAATEKVIIVWLRKWANRLQMIEGPHENPKLECDCCFRCTFATTLRIVSESIENGEHRE